MAEPRAVVVETTPWRSLDREGMTACMRLHTTVWANPEPLAVIVERQLERARPSGPAEQEFGHLVREGAVVVAMARSFWRPISIAGAPCTVLALASVCVDPGRRGEGLGEAVVRAAWSRLKRDASCLFQTGVPGFYQRLGARLIDNPITSNGRSFWEPHAMIYPAAAPWPAGTIDLLGDGW